MNGYPGVILAKGSDHEGSTTTSGLVLHYQFRRLPICFDIGIRDIRLAETTDDFLDLYNEIQNVLAKGSGSL